MKLSLIMKTSCSADSISITVVVQRHNRAGPSFTAKKPRKSIQFKLDSFQRLCKCPPGAIKVEFPSSAWYNRKHRAENGHFWTNIFLRVWIV